MSATLSPGEIARYLSEVRGLVGEEIERIIPDDPELAPIFYDLMRDYPLRPAKGLRPAICVATCRAMGGNLEAALPTAAVLELYHNAFLVHDDVEDGSLQRRDRPTLHRAHGVPVAVNVGDGMLALALGPLLENMRLLGMGRAIRILQLVARMARETAEGQAMELAWVRDARWDLGDADYLRMVYKKTGWYSFIAPMLIGAAAAGGGGRERRALFRLGALLGGAFQIQDDVLNLVGDERAYGKEIAGDLWEGKRTLILLHALRSASPSERARAEAILARPRPDPDQMALSALIDALSESGDLSPAGRSRLEARLAGAALAPKTAEEIDWLLGLIHRCDSLGYARDVARGRAEMAARQLTRMEPWMGPSTHRALLRGLVRFVVERAI